MTHHISLAKIGYAAADLIERVGWTQGAEKNDAGQVCLTGALRYCDPKPGDFYLARAVWRRRDRGESWNDQRGRSRDDVLAELRRDVTDADLEATFGPCWRKVVTLVRRAAVLTPEEGKALAAAWAAAWAAAGDAARDAARDAAWAAAGDAAWAAAWAAAGDAARDAAWAAARDAAWAAIVHDLIPAEQYQLLVGPWESVCGPLVDAEGL